MTCGKIPTCENWHWKITAEDIAKIKANDRPTIDKVYFDNLESFRKCAYNFCRKHRAFDLFDDCLQELYITLPNWDYRNTKTLFWSIKRTFYNACLFEKIAFSLDEPLREDSETTKGEMLQAAEPSVTENDQKESFKKLLNLLAKLDLKDTERDALICQALGISLKYLSLYGGVYAQYRNA